MKRYSVLFLASFFLVAIAVSCTAYLSDYFGRSIASETKGTITVYTTLPAENVACLANEYERHTKIKVNFVPLTEDELLNNAKSKPKADVILTDSRIIKKIASEKDNNLLSHFSEVNDSVEDEFKDDNGLWTGVWYDPVVFCVNKDFLIAKGKNKVPIGWKYISENNDMRIGLTDPMAADAAANILYFLVAQYGKDKALRIYNGIHPKVVQYSKYLSTPVRMAGMGEVDLSIAVRSEAIRYINDGYPLRMIYPVEGTPYMLTAVAIVKTTANPEWSRAFSDWLLSDDAQLILQNNDFFFIPTSHANMVSKLFTEKNIILFPKQPEFSIKQKKTILNDWMKQVRFKPESK